MSYDYEFLQFRNATQVLHKAIHLLSAVKVHNVFHKGKLDFFLCIVASLPDQWPVVHNLDHR